MSASGGADQGARIVVIDDTTEILDLIEAVLGEEGFEVVSCREASEALDTVAAQRPMLVIADLRMAGVENWELIDALISDPTTGRTPVIVCSGAVVELQAGAGRLREHGGDILVKPFDIDVLVQMVHELIAASRQGEHATGGPDPTPGTA